MRTTQLVSLFLGGAVAVTLTLLIGPRLAGADGAQSMHLKVRNQTTAKVTVRVLHSDGKLQKQETIAPGDTHRFKFDWCYDCCGHDKERKFEAKTGETLRATGELYMATKKVVTGPQGGTTCDEYNNMTVKDADETDAWTFSTDYENGHRTAILTVKQKTS